MQPVIPALGRRSRALGARCSASLSKTLASSHTHKPLGPKAPPWPHLLTPLPLLLPTEPCPQPSGCIRWGQDPLSPPFLMLKFCPFCQIQITLQL